MAFTPENFVDKTGPVVSAAFLNGLDQTVNRGLNGLSTQADIAAWLGISFPISVAEGGTGQTTAAAALAALGGTTLAAVETVINNTYIGGQIWPQTADELAKSVTPTFLYYPPYDVRRYGAIGNGVVNDTAALITAFLFGLVNFPGPAFSFLISATLPYSVSQGVINGNGSKLVISSGWTPVSNVMTNI